MKDRAKFLIPILEEIETDSLVSISIGVKNIHMGGNSIVVDKLYDSKSFELVNPNCYDNALEYFNDDHEYVIIADNEEYLLGFCITVDNLMEILKRCYQDFDREPTWTTQIEDLMQTIYDSIRESPHSKVVKHEDGISLDADYDPRMDEFIDEIKYYTKNTDYHKFLESFKEKIVDSIN